MKKWLLRYAVVFVLLALVMGCGRSDVPADEFCSGHTLIDDLADGWQGWDSDLMEAVGSDLTPEVKKKWTITQGGPIDVLVGLRMGGNGDWIGLEPNESDPVWLGYVCAPAPLEFSVLAIDPDRHVCEGPSMRHVFNFIAPSDSVAVRMTSEDWDHDLASELDSPQAGSRVAVRGWTNSVLLETPGDVLVRYSGTIADEPCPDHPNSVDTNVCLSPYQARLTVVRTELKIWNGGGELTIGERPGAQGSRVPASDRETVGAYLQVNWDNDDGSGTRNPDGTWAQFPVPDLEKDFVENENNLARLKPVVEPLFDTGIVTLEISGPDRNKARFWTSSSKGTEVSFPSYRKVWDLSDAAHRADLENVMENSLWIEGIAPGTTERGITFSLKYMLDGNFVCEDKATATVVFMRLGSAVYRDLRIRPHMGHGAIFYRFKQGVELTRDNLTDPANYQVLHSMPPPSLRLAPTPQNSGPTIDDYTNIADNPRAANWPGCYETPSLSYAQRLVILHEAVELLGFRAAISYPSGRIPRNVLVTTSGGTATWNGDFSDIRQLRCDGLIEVIYEKPGAYIGDVWGKRIDNVWRYAISTYAYVHNEQRFGRGVYSRYFNPATQSGRTTPAGDTQTRFQHRQYVVEPAMLE